MNYIKRYSQFVIESLENKNLEDKISDKFKDIKIDFLEILSKSIGSDEIDIIKEFLLEYVKENSKSAIEGLVNDADINQFYIKYGNDIDEILESDGSLERSPVDIESFSLYDYVVKQTKTALKELAKMILSDLESDVNQNESLMFWKNKNNKDVGKLILVDNKSQGNTFVYQILEELPEQYRAALIGSIKKDKFSQSIIFTPWLGQRVNIDGKSITKNIIYDMVNKPNSYRPNNEIMNLLRRSIVGEVKSKIESSTKNQIVWIN